MHTLPKSPGNTRLEREFRAARRRNGYGGLVGHRAAHALSEARTRLLWEQAEEASLVRLRLEPEEESYFDVYGEPDSKRERDAIIREIELNGCWYMLGEYRLPDGSWEHGNSIGMITGYDDPSENWYTADIMAETIDALRKALRSRCPACRRSA